MSGHAGDFGEVHLVIIIIIKQGRWEFPGSPGIKIRRFHCRGPGSFPGWGTRILQATQRGPPPQKKSREGKRKLDWRV